MNFTISITRAIKILILILFLSNFSILYSQDPTIPAETADTVPPIAENDASAAEKTDRTKNVNIDAGLMYGQYNNILSTLSLIQSTDSFAYQLNADFTRSNDFGYKNSSFYESEVGFSGKGEVMKNWSIIPLLEIYNESHGMFDNSTYNREEKDKIVVLLKNEYKPTPTRWLINLGGAQYVHRLAGTSPFDMSLYRVNEEVEWEYVWSASYQWSVKHYSSHYFYEDASNDDYHVGNEIMGSFKIAEYVKISAGGIVDWNRDSGLFPSGRVQIASVGLNYFIIEGGYVYDLIPFKPEDLYFEQKFIYPNNNLPPSKVHRGDIKGSFEISNKKKSDIYIKKIKLKCRGIIEDHDNFYNFDLLPEDVLGAETVKAYFFNLESEAGLDMGLYSYEVGFLLNYKFHRYSAGDNITYRPEHQVEGGITFSSDAWALQWSNTYNGPMYISPDSGEKLDGFLVGMLELRIQMVESLFLNLKLDNLYNVNYRYLPGYPEPGFTFLAGLRMII